MKRNINAEERDELYRKIAYVEITGASYATLARKIGIEPKRIYRFKKSDAYKRVLAKMKEEWEEINKQDFKTIIAESNILIHESIADARRMIKNKSTSDKTRLDIYKLAVQMSGLGERDKHSTVIHATPKDLLSQVSTTQIEQMDNFIDASNIIAADIDEDEEK